MNLPNEDGVGHRLAILAADERFGDEAYAHAEQRYKTLLKEEKTYVGDAYLEEKGKVPPGEKVTQAELDHRVYSSEKYRTWREMHDEALAEYLLIRNKRNSIEHYISVWQSLNRNRAQG